MVGRYAHRAIEVLVLLFAALGFVYVPLGKHTGYEHAKAILATGAASRAGREVGEAVDRLRGRAIDDATSAGPGARSAEDQGEERTDPVPEPPRFGSRPAQSGPAPNNAALTAGSIRGADAPDASVPYPRG